MLPWLQKSEREKKKRETEREKETGALLKHPSI